MPAQPGRIPRLFSRRQIVLASQQIVLRRAQASSEMSTREFRALSHVLTHGEPTRFELCDSNFVEGWREFRDMLHASYRQAGRAL